MRSTNSPIRVYVYNIVVFTNFFTFCPFLTDLRGFEVMRTGVTGYGWISDPLSDLRYLTVVTVLTGESSMSDTREIAPSELYARIRYDPT